MRTLKKTLCLVLVLAMMVGLCAVGASAAKLDDYSDKDAIQNKEAVAILSALKVLEGDERGFRPADTLTRAEGAAIMTRLLASTGAGVSSFTDMASAAWAQPYVAFCEASGIIAGMGDGTFQPQATLTVAQFAKMMLAALGYDAKAEGLTGNAWEINTVKLVNKIDLAAGLTNLDYNAAITRDAAAQMAFNTLKATMVEYKGGVNVKTSDGTTIDVNVQASDIENNSFDYRNKLNHEPTGKTMQFCENYFPTLKMTSEKDAFKMDLNNWWIGDSRKDQNYKESKKIVSELANNVMATYDTTINRVSGKTLYTDGKANEAKTLTVYVNGAELTGGIKMDRTKTTPELGAYKGATAYLLDTSAEDSPDYGIADTLVIKVPYLAQVLKITAATAAADRTASLKVYTVLGGKNFDYATEDFAQFDWILVYPSDTTMTKGTTTILEAAKADSAKGTLSKVGVTSGVASALTIDGVAYSVGSNAYLGPKSQVVATAAANYSLGTGLTAYTSNGFVLGVMADAVAYGDFVFVIDAKDIPSMISNTTYTVGSVDQTGAATEVRSAREPAKNVWASKSEGANGFVTFTEAKAADGVTSLTKDVAINGLSSSKADIGSGIIADSNTVFIIRTEAASGVSYKSYTGLANVPNFYATADVPAGKTALTTTGRALVPDYPGAHAAAVYIDAKTASAKNVTTATIYLVSDKASAVERVGARDYYTYTAIVDGAVKDILGTKNTMPVAGVVVPSYSGEYLDSTEAGTAVKETVTDYAISMDAGVLTVNGNTYVINANAVAYVYNTLTRQLDTGAPKDYLNGEVKGTLSLIAAKDGTYNTIYFIK